MPVKDGEGRLLAVVQAINKHRGAFSSADEDILFVLCGQIGLSVSNSLSYGALLGSCAKRTSLAAACCMLGGITTLDQLSRAVASSGVEVMHCRRAGLYVYDRSCQSLTFRDTDDGTVRSLSVIDVANSLLGEVVFSGDQCISGLIEMEAGHGDMQQTQQTVMNAQSYQPCIMASPVKLNGSILGVIEFTNKQGSTFDSEDQILASMYDV
jgi:transcriptional regulator with GAF, ATPase, and Fis domain